MTSTHANIYYLRVSTRVNRYDLIDPFYGLNGWLVVRRPDNTVMWVESDELPTIVVSGIGDQIMEIHTNSRFESLVLSRVEPILEILRTASEGRCVPRYTDYQKRLTGMVE